jgi:hypothetical protein
MELLNLVYTFIILAAVYFLFFRKHVKEGFEAANAQEACNEISSKADEIAAAGKAASSVIDSVLGFLSPNNYKSGDNETKNRVTNVMNTAISPEIKTKIVNECQNLSTSLQSNVIDNTACEYCKSHECTISNITQENIKEAEQNCMLNSVVTTLMQTQNDIASQALAEAIQKSQGILSGDNSSSSNTCNVVNTEISPKSYLEVLNKCANTSSSDQNNTLKGCGSMTNIIQRNVLKDIQKCVITNTTTQTEDTSNKTTTKTDIKSNQTSEGLPAWASIASIFSICIASIVMSLVLGFVANTATEKAASVISEHPELLQSMGQGGTME